MTQETCKVCSHHPCWHLHQETDEYGQLGFEPGTSQMFATPARSVGLIPHSQYLTTTSLPCALFKWSNQLCNLLLAIASAVILGFGPHRTHDHTFCLTTVTPFGLLLSPSIKVQH
jgi:hypothetical protein